MLGAAALLACFLPARRAMRVTPDDGAAHGIASRVADPEECTRLACVPRLSDTTALLFSDLAVAANDVFVGRQFFETHRAARMKLVGADADLRAETKLAAIGETGGSIPIDRRGIDFAEESFRQFLRRA